MSKRTAWIVISLLVLTIATLSLLSFFLWRQGREREAQIAKLQVQETPPETVVPEVERSPMEEIHRAVRQGDVVRLRKLLDAHPDLLNANTHNRFGSTPLHFAAFFKQTEVAAELLKRGANVNARNNQGATPLHDAIASGSEGILVLLLDHGADIAARNDAGEDALAYAEYKNRPAMTKLIRQRSNGQR